MREAVNGFSFRAPILRPKYMIISTVYIGELAEGAELVAKVETPLLPLERRAYLLAIQQMVAGLVEAREVLAKALPRVEKAEAHMRQYGKGEYPGRSGT
jgi:hypothetical protein